MVGRGLGVSKICDHCGCRLVLDATGDGAANTIADRDSAQRWTPTGDACASPVDLMWA